MMKSMVWNVRGLCNSSNQKEMVSMMDRNGVSMCALLETRVHISRINKICHRMKRSWQWCSNASLCSRGTRIAIGWDPGAWDVYVIHSYDQIVHFRVHPKNSNHTFFISFVYAENDYRDRRRLWDYLRIHHSLVKDQPWLIVGDFNQVLKPSESTRSSSYDCLITEFQRCIDDINIADIKDTGLYYTWNQKPRGNGGRLRKLDRTMALRTEFEKSQEQLDRDPENEEISLEHAVYMEEFTKALGEEESLLRQKAKLIWLKDGDMNTKFYHKVIKERQSRNKINSITGGEGVVHGVDKVTDIAIAHFSNFLGKARVVEPIISPNDLFRNTLTNEDANWMIRPIEDEEIR
ncbi:unnamed protein product [Lactuca virosa]|uniref:Endonuclease/exonuclease/phosphatase domain-containing protein n=1 Tax=Lactuca virosa TaxID=75947 RepID=A0AAU9M6Y0_9ASTR|nr:unnamed protein product [Lactuca virosa]